MLLHDDPPYTVILLHTVAADKLLVKEADAGQLTNEEATLHNYQSTSTIGASVNGLGGGAVLSLGGDAMNFASLLGGGGRHWWPPIADKSACRWVFWVDPLIS